MAEELDARERLFVAEYLIDLDPKRAAIAAGYSESMADTKAYQWVSPGKSTKPHVLAEIRRRQDKAAKRLDISADRVRRELALIAFADIRDAIAVDDDGTVRVKDLETLAPEVTRAIGEITQTSTERFDPEKGATIEKVRLGVKHHSKTTALRMLMDHLGMDAEKRVKIDADMTGTVRKLIERLGSKMQPEAFKELLRAMAEEEE